MLPEEDYILMGKKNKIRKLQLYATALLLVLFSLIGGLLLMILYT
jgi:hypothetical protein